MNNTNAFEGLDDYAIDLIIFKSKRLCRQIGLTESDLEDVELDLVLYLRSRLGTYDPQRAAYSTFVNCVLENRVREIVYERTRPTYDYRRNEYSLNDSFVDVTGDILSKGDLIEDDYYQIRQGNRTRTQIELAELRVDVGRALECVPEEWRDICALLSEHSLLEVSRITGMKRHYLNTVKCRIQELFIDFGLDIYHWK